MIIQHNIMAMNAYRNYKANTSALSSNLEKLSSGYKINRAGDDAAGLAISEKMRAQITGLEAAQKNVKDGISLVKTAEGAMQEIQDMLNRMDYLATQSANGTYDNETDRANLQKEVEALKTEINRIADSANFNGIKLLDGSLDPNATNVGAADANPGTVSSLVSSNVGSTLGTSTILHSSGTAASETQFGVDLHEVSFENKLGQTFELTIGGNTFTLAGGDSGTAGTALSAKEIVDAFIAGDFKDSSGAAVSASSVSLTDGSNTGTFTATADGTRIKFAQASGETPVDGDMTVTADGATADTPSSDPTNAAVAVTTAGAAAATAKYTYDFAGVAGLSAGNYDVEIAGQKVTVTLADGATTASDLADAVATALGSTGPADGIGASSTYTIANANGATTITFTASGDGEIDPANAISGDIKITPSASGVTGDYNVKTTVTANGAEQAAGRLASGVATFAAKDFADGNIIKIGDKEYTITTADADKSKVTANTDNKVYVGDLNLSTGDGLKAAIDRLGLVADSNSVWTLGNADTTGKATFVEKVNASGKSYTEQKTGADGKLEDGAFDLSKEAVIKETIGGITGKTDAVAGTAGKALTLQIGDTSEEFNQMKVTVGDMHTDAMGAGEYMGQTITKTIADVDIGDQDGASEAINIIRNAINYVSGVRGDLGAVQNRLEHTANNLSVMAENIQDAESTIRDTDVAEEMMSYVKNNILVQSAQAMLAQANQVPQGVLQLLG